MSEGEAAEAAPEAEEGKKKKGIKGLIIKIIPLLLIAFLVAKMTVLKPPPPTAIQKAAAQAVAENMLDIKCSLANGKRPPAPLDLKAAEAKFAAAAGTPVAPPAPTTTTTTLVPPVHEPAGPTLLLEPVTVNLADGHFLKMAVALQLPVGALVEDIEAEHPGSAALNYIIAEMRTKTMKKLGPEDLDHIREDLGYKICVNHELNAEGTISTIYFTDFVAQ